MRPVRNNLEKLTERAPSGPFNIVGGGNLTGLVGFSAVTFANTLSPVPVGYSVQSSSVSTEDDLETHEYEVWGASRDIVRFAAMREAAGPNLNFLTDSVSVMSVEEIKSRGTHSLWHIRVEVDRTNTVVEDDVREALA